MKKAFFSFAIAAMMLSMISCGGNKSDQPQAAADGAADEQVDAAPADAPAAKIETRGTDYQVAIPAGWDSHQYVSEMTVKKDSKELNFKEGANAELQAWEANMSSDNKLDDIVVEGRTWVVYRNEKGFKTVYLTQLGTTVVRVGSNVEDASDAEVLTVLAGVGEYVQ